MSGEVAFMSATAKEGATSFVPADRTLPVLREAVQNCRGCDLYRNASQAVFGELETGATAKRPKVAIMMIGEQPGNQEDKEGRPFVGPAGRLLDKCLEEVELIGARSTLQTQSNTSNGNRVVSSGSTKNPAWRKYTLAGLG
jgi:uracil-DNA glycosylase